MKKKIIFFVGLFAQQTVLASNLIDVYQEALLHDPTYLSVKAQSLSTQEQLAIDKALLLPNISLSANVSQSHYVVSETNKTYAINLSQSVFDYGLWSNISADKKNLQQAHYSVAASLQDLMIRTANAYVSVAKAQEQLELVVQQRDAEKKLLDLAKKRFQAGQIIATDITDIKAAYANSIQSVIEAETTLANKRSELSKLTGNSGETLLPLKSNFPLKQPVPNQLSAWISKATQNNMAVKASRAASLAQKQAISTQRAGHYPTVNATASYGKNFSIVDEESNDFRGGQVGLNFSLPLFSGGAVTAKTRQADAQYQIANQQLQANLDSAVDQTRQSFVAVNNGMEELRAEKAAIQAYKEALDNTMISYNAGLREANDVVSAENAYYLSKVNYIETKYTYFIATLTLKQASGSLNVNDLKAINQWLG